VKRKWTKTQREAARASSLAAVARRRAAGLPVGRPSSFATDEERTEARRRHAREAMRRWRSKSTNRKKTARWQREYLKRPEIRKRETERWLEWRRKNPEKAKAISARYWAKGQKNPKTAARRRENQRRHYSLYKARWKAYEHRRRVREHKDCADLAYTAKEWTEAVQARFKLRGGRCVRCGSRKALEVDHVVPLARGGSHLPSNIQPLCRPCNRSKGARFSG
jgi:5-methylcytosine-specific restriction endonuclease McrA